MNAKKKTVSAAYADEEEAALQRAFVEGMQAETRSNIAFYSYTKTNLSVVVE